MRNVLVQHKREEPAQVFHIAFGHKLEPQRLRIRLRHILSRNKWGMMSVLDTILDYRLRTHTTIVFAPCSLVLRTFPHGFAFLQKPVPALVCRRNRQWQSLDFRHDCLRGDAQLRRVPTFVSWPPYTYASSYA